MDGQETAVRSWSHEFGRRVLEVGYNLDLGHVGQRTACGQGHEAEFVAYRDKTFSSTMGPVELKRAYYHCSACAKGVVPKDRKLGLVDSTATPSLLKMICRVGLEEAFVPAREDLAVLADVEVSAKRVERATEAIGARAIEKMESELTALGAGVVLPALHEEKKPKILYCLADGTGVPTVAKETEGRKGKSEDGRARTREVKLGALFTQTSTDEEGWPIRDEATTSYVATMKPAEDFGLLLKGEAIGRGYQQAEVKVFLGDGSEWIWHIAEEHFPDAIQVVDLYHAKQNLHKLAKIAFPFPGQEREQWLRQALDNLDNGDLEMLLVSMRELQCRKTTTWIDEEALETAIAYFENNQERMSYGEHADAGLFVGSGVVEAGCKTVVAHRCKQSGMFWTLRGVGAVIVLRCLFLSGRWEELWGWRYRQMQAA